ncbi:MAG: hypothetical protein CO094_11000 [Anaerolineae bacterium CG_4_9_14_3_um_filter_57_17]|nr:hypothetical protein [bacterium]NCT20450.1 hypothetical protein [bacterium]OIO83972.1 MAG: hypothetical protein AUK01_10850 [Anaerolineae bacterium CG2_30_57_67]PJB65080.1 MAG: hypothetical protein CO094_11000 [Anaerolineae bacterium CG_4_9_14_3_um_filter_57_17]
MDKKRGSAVRPADGSTRRLPLFLTGLIFPLLTVFFFKTNVAAQSDLTRPLDFSRYGLIAANYLREIWDFGGWPLSQALLALIALQQAGYFFIYVITPHDLQLHLDTSLVRLLYQTYPLTLFTFFTLSKNSPC